MIRIVKDIANSVKSLGKEAYTDFTKRYQKYALTAAFAEDKANAQYVAGIESMIYSKFLHGVDAESLAQYKQVLQRVEAEADYIDEAYKFHYMRMGQLDTLKDNIGPELKVPENAKIKWLIELTCSDSPSYDASTNLDDADLNNEITDLCKNNMSGGNRKRIRKTKKRATKKRRATRRKTTVSSRRRPLSSPKRKALNSSFSY